MKTLTTAIVLSSTALVANASETFHPLRPDSYPGEWASSVTLETRYYRYEGAKGQDQHSESLALTTHYQHSWEGDRSNIDFRPFVRIDRNDSERTHVDIRELSWSTRDSNWAVRGGIGQVHWGVTELTPIVDVINQWDAVEGKTTERLGQPLLQFTQMTNVGTFDIYALFGFRPRTFLGEDSRLRTPITVDTHDGMQETSSEPMDMALRWQKTWSDFTVALGQFHGVSRDPHLIFNFDFENPQLIPIYEQVEQSSIELQYLFNHWTFKAEALGRWGSDNDYDQAKAGIEYTWGSLFDTDIDLIATLEYLWDSREALTPTFLDDDYLAGARLHFNDVYDTQLESGIIYDETTREQAITLGFKRSLDDQWDIRVAASLFVETDPAPPAYLPSQRIGSLLEQITNGNISEPEAAREALLELLEYNTFIDADSAQLQQFVGELVLTDLASTLDQQTLGQVLDDLYVMGDPYRKLNLYQHDDYIQLEITRNF